MHIHNIHKNVTAMYSSVHSISDLLFFIEMQPFDSNAIFLFIRFALSTNIKFRGLILPHFQYYGFKCFLTHQNKYLYKIHFWGHWLLPILLQWYWFHSCYLLFAFRQNQNYRYSDSSCLRHRGGRGRWMLYILCGSHTLGPLVTNGLIVARILLHSNLLGCWVLRDIITQNVI